MLKNTFVFLAIAIAGFACASNPAPNANVDSNMPSGKEIRLDPANMPAGLSATPLPPGNMPPGISVNAVNMPLGNKPIPGIPSAEQLRKGFTPGKTPIPGIPDQATIRKQMGLPVTNAQPSNVPMMKSNKK